MSDEFCESLNETCGVAIGDGYVVPFCGACPVQGYGQIDGHFCYFRARHDSWRVEVFAEGAGVTEQNYVSKWCDDGVRPVFTHHGDAENSGWQPAACSIAQIEEAAAAFREWASNNT